MPRSRRNGADADGMLRVPRPVLLAAMSVMHLTLDKLTTPDCDLPACSVEPLVSINQSTVCDGRGLFAQTSMPMNSLVALYPVHAIGIETDTGEVEMAASAKPDILELIRDSEYRVTLPHRGFSHMCIDTVPQYVSSLSWSGWAANDAARCEGRSAREVERYLEASVIGANSALVAIGPPPLVGLVTTRDVDAGEELFTSYGPGYWLESKDWDERGTQLIVELQAARYAAVEAAEVGARRQHAKGLALLDDIFHDVLAIKMDEQKQEL